MDIYKDINWLAPWATPNKTFYLKMINHINYKSFKIKKRNLGKISKKNREPT